jgi:putative pyruvate formate lyase activating enzyme
VDRIAGGLGFCGEGARLRIADIEAHLGEEPPIRGENGSGAVFFSGCSLRCDFCQNYQISREGWGRDWTPREVVDHLVMLHKQRKIHNVNFVTPDHFLPHTISVVRLLREKGICLPTVYNLSGYQALPSLRLIESVADIYLPDFKFADATLAHRFSQAGDYAKVALAALSEMVRQKGFLDTLASQGTGPSGSTSMDDFYSPAGNGVLVRHLILPGHIRNSIEALSMLFVEFGKDLPISLMSQYVPIQPFPRGSSLNRRVSQVEFEKVLQHAQELGLRNVFVQYPSVSRPDTEPFLPDFRAPHPFPGNTGDKRR